MKKTQLRTQGRGIFKKEWYSFCSRRGKFDENCHICNVGTWNNVYKRIIGSLIHKHFYKLWFWFVNRENSKTRKRIKKYFPNLK